ncbi:lantibiotic dehydratase family protein [Lipingzhangella sp. LS1_29]|uniref:Lantibiotic dehydratase family protein n=1 Tax=Lipingzhangella rawalii TaxID=2055835 RepID=A0ABU2HAZ8_9ACTN|nr:lantibiotic dehydratase family protein [Lipingzhangella rawalii]MDS1272433.1 lantibiotic dehydratase family protein [Lipingzhangella rawalii]
MPPWPGAKAPLEHWRGWLVTVWADDTFRRAVSAASPNLEHRVQSIIDGHSPKPRRVRRAALAIARYAVRYTCRSTPFGWFAGVAPITFGGSTRVGVGNRHRVITRADPQALDAAISSWETDSERMVDFDVCVNNLVQRRAGRLYVPSEGPSEFSLVATPEIELVMEAARSPMPFTVLRGKLAVEFPDTPEHHWNALLTQLLRIRLLQSSLRAPATVADPVTQLPSALREHMKGYRSAVDLRLEATVRLPASVVTEAETAATALTRLVRYPGGTPAWQRYTERFAEHYGDGAEVPVEQVIDPKQGLGLPEGFAGVAEPPRPMTLRDRLLLELAATAALEGRTAVVLSESTIERLEAAAGRPALTAPHLELCAQLQALSKPALDAGAFRLRVSTVSRGVGSMTGRFWHLFDDPGVRCTDLSTVEPGAELAQLSFHPARTSGDLLTRTPQVLPRIVSVGEFRTRTPEILFPSDLAVGLNEGRLYLTETATGTRLELLAPTAINFQWNNYTPPLVRFLAELSRAATPQVTWFDWGAAWALPFTPALHYRRSILTPARWKLHARELPGHAATSQEWTDGLHDWMRRLNVPDQLLLAQDDQQLPLDLRHEMHRELLRSHLATAPNSVAVLVESPSCDADGWIDGRAHSLVFPLGARS